MSRHFVLILVALAMIGASCGGETRVLSGTAADIYGDTCASSTGETVTIYSGRTENLIEPVLDAFACETGIGVAVRWGSSTDLALLIAEEGDKSPADVFLSRSPGPVGFLESEDLLGSIDQQVLDLVEPGNRSDSGRWVGFSGRKRVLVYNQDEVSTDGLPASIFDLTEERYRGQVAIPATNGSFVDWFTVFRDQHGSDVASDWLVAMVANDAQPYPNNRAIVEAVGRGEIEMGLVNHYYNYQEQIALGDAHRAENHNLADDDIGSLLIITAASVIGSSENTEEANRLMEYLLTGPVQTYFSQETFEYPLAAGIEPAEILPPLSALEIGTVDFDALGGGFEETTAIIEASGILSQ